MRVVAGFVFAPIVPAILVAIIGYPPAGIFVAMFGYPAILLFGLPSYMLLEKLRWSGWGIYIVVGFITGVLYGLICIIVVAFPFVGKVRYGAPVEGSSFDVVPFLFTGGLGAIGALTFWLIARPDLHHVNSTQSTG